MARIVLWAAFLVTVVYVILQQGPRELVVPLGLFALGLWMWGCALYAHAKGYSPVFGAVLGIPNIIGLAVIVMLPKRTRPPAEALILAEGEFRVPAPRPKVPPDCLCCGNPAKPAHHLTGKSRRMWLALVLLLAVALVALGIQGDGNLDATFALLGIASYFVATYAIFYGIFVFPVLMFSRKWVNQGGRFAELAASVADVAAFGVLLLFIGYNVANKAGELPGVAIGAAVVVLLAIVIERIGTVYAPVCPSCYTAARTGVRIVDYAPLGNELVLLVTAQDIANRLAYVTRSAPRPIEGVVRGPSAPPAAADDKNRRPCPKCGRMNLDWISKCPGCNAKLA